MIPRRYIQEWKERFPWPEDAQVEQDMMLSRIIIDIFNDPFLKKRLAFRGGTAIHKLFLMPQQRYSEDIDLVQLHSEPIKETIDQFRNLLSFLGNPKVKQKASNNVLIYRFTSETLPSRPIRVKIEINCREHSHVLPLESIDFTMSSEWFTGSAHVSTYKFEELAATKLRALYQRKKGRDLYDIKQIIESGKVDLNEVIKVWQSYVDKPPTSKQFKNNMILKFKDPDFRNDIHNLLRPGNKYEFEASWQVVMDKLISKIE